MIGGLAFEIVFDFGMRQHHEALCNQEQKSACSVSSPPNIRTSALAQ